MPRTTPIFRTVLRIAGCLFFVPFALSQQVIDRIVARIENDVILESDIRLLAHYQLLVEGKAESEAEILDRLIDQWIVRNEANVARTPQPTDADIARAVDRLIEGFSSKEDFEARQKLAGLGPADIRRVTADQLFLNSYLDSRFRPTVQVDEPAIRDFYQNALLPRAQARGTTAPTFDAAHDFIQEALIQRGINEQADRWLKESHGRIRVTKMLEENRP